MIICSKCGCENPDWTKSCCRCGVGFGAIQTKACTICGSEFRGNSPVCAKCAQSSKDESARILSNLNSKEADPAMKLPVNPYSNKPVTREQDKESNTREKIKMETKSHIYYERLIAQEEKNKVTGRNNAIAGAVLILIAIVVYFTLNILFFISLGVFLPLGIYQYSKANTKILEAQEEMKKLSKNEYENRRR